MRRFDKVKHIQKLNERLNKKKSSLNENGMDESISDDYKAGWRHSEFENEEQLQWTIDTLLKPKNLKWDEPHYVGDGTIQLRHQDYNQAGLDSVTDNLDYVFGRMGENDYEDDMGPDAEDLGSWIEHEHRREQERIANGQDPVTGKRKNRFGESKEGEFNLLNEGTLSSFEKLCGVKIIKESIIGESMVTEEMYDLKRDLESALGRGFKQKDAEYHLGRPLTDYEASELFGGGNGGGGGYSKPTYQNDLKSQSSKYEITSVEAKTGKAVLVGVKELATDRTKQMWVPKSQIKGGVVAAWVIKKNFG